MYKATALLVLALLLAPGSVGSARAASVKQGMFDIYEANRQHGLGNYITEDFVLLAYAMTLREALGEMEEAVLLPTLDALVAGSLKKVSSSRHPGKTAALRFLGMLQALLQGKAPSGGKDAALLREEYTRVQEAKGIAVSPVAMQPLDYSQYKARGAYTRSEKLAGYFRAMQYAGAVLAPALASKATGMDAKQADQLMAMALCLAQAIQSDPKLTVRYERLLQNTAWFFGPADDFSFLDCLEVASSMPQAGMEDVRRTLFVRAGKEGKKPRILSMAVDTSALESGVSPQDVVTGARFLPQHFSPDAGAMQLLVYDSVTEFRGEGTPFTLAMINGKAVKGLPLGLELMALLGSPNAATRLQASGDRNYDGYAQAAAKATALLTSGTDQAGGTLALLGYWVSRGGCYPGAPTEDQRLNTALSVWTLYRYRNLLYAKQSYTASGKGLAVGDKREMAWLEPAAELYLHLIAMLDDALSHFESPRLRACKEQLKRCHAIASKESLGVTLSEDDIAFLNALDKTFKPLAGGDDRPVVVDVHTEPTSKVVLQEALAWPVVVESQRQGQTLRGARFHYGEFTQPMDQRLDDASWQEKLDNAQAVKAMRFSPGTIIPFE